MTADLSQFRFDKRNRYSKVVHQQGRVFSDADFVEAAYITAYFEETERVDVIGSNGAPVHDAGFLLVDGDDPKDASGKWKPAADVPWTKLSLSAGRCYIRGKVAEIFADAAEALPKVSDALEAGTAEPAAGTYRVVLEIYERYVSPEEEREQMLDDALRGVDTTGRTRLEWRIRLEPGEDGEDCADVPEAWPVERTYPELLADAPAPDENTDPCDAPNLGGYQGLENQLYRVEVYDAGHLTWARDNASMLAEVESVADNPDGTTGTIQLFTLGRDPKIGIQQGQILEILTRDDLKHGRRGILVTDFSLPEGESQVVVNTDWATVKAAAEQGFIRRWHGQAKGVQSETNVALEKDLFVKIKDVSLLMAGDYWCIPTRALSGKVLWPIEPDGKTRKWRPPFGTYRYTAVLGIAKRTGNKWSLLSDCRNIFYPLTEQTRLLYVGGDGQEAMPGNKFIWPLQVGVVNGVVPAKGAKVRWEVLPKAGTTSEMPTITLDPAGGGVVPTDQFGISSITAGLDGTDPMEEKDFTIRVRATLLDEHEVAVDVPVHFTLRRSVARNVWYTPDKCPNLSGRTTVQAAIERLAAIRRFVMDGGDTQVVRRDRKKPAQFLPLEHPLVARLYSRCGTTEGTEVIFTPNGGGSLAKDKTSTFSPDPLKVMVDGQGRASCFWQPGTEVPISEQFVEATYDSQADLDGVEGPWTTRFVCQELEAKDIGFDPEGSCTLLKEVETVQQALDTLCANLGQVPQRFYNLVKVVAGPDTDEVENDGKLRVDSFFNGLTFIFDQKVMLNSKVFNRGTVSVEAELVASAINDKFGFGLRLRTVLLERKLPEFKSGRVTWFPPDTPLARYIDEAVEAKDQGLLIRVTLRGDYLPADLDGGAAYLRNATSDIGWTNGQKLVNDSGGPGGNVEFWFWLVKPDTTPRTVKIKALKAVGKRSPRRLTLTYAISFTEAIPATGAKVSYSIVTASGQAVLGPEAVLHEGGAETVENRLVFQIPVGTNLPTEGLRLQAELEEGNSRTAKLVLTAESEAASLTLEVVEVVPNRSVRLKLQGIFPTEIPAGEVKTVEFIAKLVDPTTPERTSRFVAKFAGNGTKKAVAEAELSLRQPPGAPLPERGWILTANFDGTEVQASF